jgi:SAM-dependent methyltransferase
MFIMTSSRSDFARLFHSQVADFSEDIPMWLKLARSHGSPVLELGCGTGRVLSHLADAGHEVTGIDSNPDMIDLAKEHLTSERVTLLHTDIRDFSIAHQFPLTIAPLNVFAELSDDDLAKALSTVRDHLTRGGVLAIDLPNPRDALGFPGEDGELIQTFTERESGHAVQVSAHHRLLPSGQSVIVTWHYDEMLPDGFVTRHRFETTFHLRTPETLHEMLEQSGFAEVRLYGDYEFGALDRSSKRLIVEAVNQN